MSASSLLGQFYLSAGQVIFYKTLFKIFLLPVLCSVLTFDEQYCEFVESKHFGLLSISNLSPGQQLPRLNFGEAKPERHTVKPLE